MNLPPPLPPSIVEAGSCGFGPLLSILIPGAGQFFSDRPAWGIGWFLLFLIHPVIFVFLLTSPAVPGLIPATAWLGLGFGLWIVMILKACRPVLALGTATWIVLGVAGAALWCGELVLARSMFQLFRVPTGGMAPTIDGNRRLENGSTAPGDRLVVQKFAYWFADPKRGDIVVFTTAGIQHPNVPQDQIYIKRVVGVPGDKISIKGGRVCNHGVAVEDEFFKNNEYTLAGAHLRSEADEYEVPNAAYFVMGDNSRNSLDSRYWGAVPANNIRGRATKIYWPPSRIRSL